jgi:hypothetical protein
MNLDRIHPSQGQHSRGGRSSPAVNPQGVFLRRGCPEEVGVRLPGGGVVERESDSSVRPKRVKVLAARPSQVMAVNSGRVSNSAPRRKVRTGSNTPIERDKTPVARFAADGKSASNRPTPGPAKTRAGKNRRSLANTSSTPAGQRSLQDRNRGKTTHPQAGEAIRRPFDLKQRATQSGVLARFIRVGTQRRQRRKCFGASKHWQDRRKCRTEFLRLSIPWCTRVTCVPLERSDENGGLGRSELKSAVKRRFLAARSVLSVSSKFRWGC